MIDRVSSELYAGCFIIAIGNIYHFTLFHSQIELFVLLDLIGSSDTKFVALKNKTVVQYTV